MSVYYWLGVILLVLQTSEIESEEDVGFANDFIDEILNNLQNTKEVKEKIDPFHVPDINEEKFKAWNTWIRGLSSLHRSGDWAILYDGDNIGVLGNIALKTIRIYLDYKVKPLWWVSGTVRGTLSKLSVRARLSIDRDTLKGTLREFKVTEFGKIDIENITGLGIFLNWAFELVAEKIINNSKPKIINAMENQVAKLVGEQLKKITIPL